ncbi:PAS domain S-box-containing protein [Methanomicrobium sp. W14]|uniref:PAS domain S-box protein n=1 Tax=Methanomicrobium sp. W14 TaxID=2817839 RepID=UPI001AE67C2D|nr:PAS domain S-box protein [Methanomicrobium sp. W14]MBP2133497.1 PAS domain S-box-containing protein [Methanomicrobium sp. W14]
MLFAWWFSGNLYEERLVGIEREQFHHDFSVYSNSFTYNLNQKIDLALSLYSFVLADTDDSRISAEFPDFASMLYSEYPGINAVFLAPGGNCTYVYPKSGKKFFDRCSNLNKISTEKVAELDQKLKGRPFIIENATGESPDKEIIAVKPVFLNRTSKDSELWGFVLVAIDLPEIYRQSGFEELSGFSVAVKDNGSVIYGNVSTFENDPGIYEMYIGDKIWTLALAPENGWNPFVESRVSFFRAVTLVLGIIAVILIGYSFYSYLWLNLNLKKKTGDLEKAKREIMFRDMAIESAVSPVVISNMRGRIVYMNKAALKLWNLDKRSAKGVYMPSLFSRSEIVESFLRGKARSESWTGETKAFVERDKFTELYGSFSAVTDNKDNFYGVHGSFTDISALKYAENALYESEYKYHEIFDSVNEMIVVNILTSDPDERYSGKIVEVNNSACENLGYSKEELLSLRLHDIISEDSYIKIRKHYSRELVKTGLVSNEIEIVRKDKSTFPAYSKVRLLTLGERKYALSLIRDLTAEKEARKREMEALKQIEKNIARLAALNDEIRNPLAVIVGYASLNEYEDSDKILEQAKVIDNLINKLDQKWLESKKIRDYLLKYYGISRNTTDEDKGDKNNKEQ